MDINDLMQNKSQTRFWMVLLLIAVVAIFLIAKAFQEKPIEQIQSEVSIIQESQPVQDMAENIAAMKQSAPEKKSSPTQHLVQASTSDDLHKQDHNGQEEWVLGVSEPINGSAWLMLPLVLDSHDDANINSGLRSPAKNILFMNTKTNDSYWMFDNVERLILDITQFPDPYSYGPGNDQTRAIFYDVVTQDSNQDGLIGFDDSPALAVSSPQGRNYQVILNEYDNVISKTITEDKNVFMVYQNDAANYSMLFQLNPFRIISQKELPQVGSRSAKAGCPLAIDNSEEAIDCAIYHGGKISDLAHLKHELSTERSGSYWQVKQEPTSGQDFHWEFILSEGGKLMSMKQVSDISVSESVLE